MLTTTKQRNQVLQTLAFTEFFERFGFFGIMSALVLYLINHFSLNLTISYEFYGIFLALALFLPVLGGFVADHWLTRSSAIQLGILFYFTSCCILANATQLTTFLFGIAVYLSGIMLSKSNCSAAIGNLYTDNKEQREAAFRFFYAIFNLGATLGPVIFGLGMFLINWRMGFAIAAIGNFISLVLISYRKKSLKLSDSAPSSPSIFLALFFILIIIALAMSSFLYNDFFRNSFIGFYLLIILIFAYRFITGKKCYRKQLLAIYILCLFSICFFSASLQVGSSITIYLKQFIQPSIMGWPIPIPLLTALDPFFVFAAAPIFTYLWITRVGIGNETSVCTQTAVGLALVAMSFLIFIFVIKLSQASHANLTLLMLVIGYFFLGAGEIACTPALMSTISNYAPPGQKGALLGFWYLTVSLSGYVSGWLSKLASSGKLQTQIQHASHYLHIFWVLVIFTGSVALIALLIRSWFDRLAPHQAELTE